MSPFGSQAPVDRRPFPYLDRVVSPPSATCARKPSLELLHIAFQTLPRHLALRFLWALFPDPGNPTHLQLHFGTCWARLFACRPQANPSPTAPLTPSMRPSENWRSVFLLPQSAKEKKKNKGSKDSPSPPPRISFPKPRSPQTPRRHTMSGPSPRSMLPFQSPDSDISPKTPLQPSDKTKLDYFSIASQRRRDDDTKGGDVEQLSRATTLSSFASPSLESRTGSVSAESSRTEFEARHRGSSISSLAFAPTRNPSLPQGNQKKTDKERIRASSPPPER